MFEEQDLLSTLNEQDDLNVKANVKLCEITYWKIGGIAKIVVEPQSLDALVKVIKLVNTFPEIPYLVIGDSSNLLFSDDGFNGLIIKIGNGLSELEFNKNKIFCGAGLWVPELAYQSYRKGLSGIEHICGIPGRLGGLIYMNGGSNRHSISENIENITLVTPSGEVKTINASSLAFEYRQSPFQESKDIILAATLKLKYGDRNEIRNTIRKTLASRRNKFPRKLPNCGSVFVSNPTMYEKIGPPGYAIEKVGLKGFRLGDAQISPLHANFIVNLGDAKAKDVLKLIQIARKKVFDDTNFLMDCEVRFVSSNGHVCMAHEI